MQERKTFQLKHTSPPNAFWLEVHNQRLAHRDIDKGDLVVVAPGAEWKDGDLLVIPDVPGGWLAAAGYREANGVRLSNPLAWSCDLMCEEREIVGVVVKVVKDPLPGGRPKQ